jgi:hypothetical protein
VADERPNGEFAVKGRLEMQLFRIWLVGLATVGVLVTAGSLMSSSKATAQRPDGLPVRIINPLPGVVTIWTLLVAAGEQEDIRLFFADCVAKRIPYFTLNRSWQFPPGRPQLPGGS